MQKIKIITDSASDIPRELAEQYNIEILPVLISYGDKTIREFYDITTEEYWQLLLDLEEIPKTAQIQIDTYLKCYKNALDQGYTQMLYIALNSMGSGTYNTSLIARQMFYEEHGTDLKIEILDSKCYSYMYGEIVVDCAKMVLENVEFSDIVTYAEGKIEKVRAYLGVFDLKFLKKSGRISGGAAFIGEALGLKPISLVGNGSVTVCDKARGEDNLIKKIIGRIQKETINPEENTACIIHGVCDEKFLKNMKNALLNDVGFKEVQFKNLGASITTNAGPKSFGVIYYI